MTGVKLLDVLALAPNRVHYDGSAQAFVVRPGTTLTEHVTDVVGPIMAHRLGFCACPFWHQYDETTGRWYVARTCGRERVQTSQEPTLPCTVPRDYAETHAADFAARLNRLYGIDTTAWPSS